MKQTNPCQKPAHKGSYTPASRSADDISYLVIHYTGNKGDTAANNAAYFASKNRDVSAHYFVDEMNVYQSVADKDIAWHCGSTGKYVHPTCRNANSIGVEICMLNKSGGLRQGSIDNAIRLVRTLMERYHITEMGQVLRHYDVTHKQCPAPMVSNPPLWRQFQDQLFGGTDMTRDEVAQIAYDVTEEMLSIVRPVYPKYEDVPSWGQPTIKKLFQKGVLGKSGASLNLSEDCLRVLVIHDRLGIYDT